MWKKTIAVGLAFIVALGGAAAVNADSTSASSIGIIGAAGNPANPAEIKDAKITKEEAKNTSIEFLKKYFNLEIDEKKYQGSAQLIPGYDFERSYMWRFDWHMRSTTGSIHISTEINAVTGKLTGFSRNQSYSNQEQVAVADITKEQARKLADELLKKINPEEFKQVKYEDNSSYSSYLGRIRPDYNFTYIREANGLSYPGNSITVGINGTDGSVSSYHLNWKYDTKLPAADGLILKEKALEIFKDKTAMDLCYIPMRSNITRYMGTSEVKLVYSPSMESGLTVDAQTGELLDSNGEKLDSQKKRDITEEQRKKATADNSRLSTAGELSSEKAEEIINGLVKEFFGEGFKVGNLNFSESNMYRLDKNLKTWTAEIMEDKPESYEGKGNVTIDSTTGKVINIGRYMYEDWYGKEYERKLSWEQAYDKAADVLCRYYPYRLGDIKTEQVCNEYLLRVNGKLLPNRVIYFRFPRVIKGIQYANDSVSISIDTKTGEVNNMSCSWSDNLVFPEAQGTMNKEKAKELFFKEYDVKPIYSLYNKKVKENEYTTDYRIVYVLYQKQGKNGSRNIDAFSGKLLSYDGYEADKDQTDFYSVIKGSPEEKELSILAFQNIIDPGSFKPEAEATYMELLKILVNAKGYRPYIIYDREELQFKNIDKKSENYLYLMEAVRYGIIDNKPVEIKLDAKVTREQAAELLVRLLKYEKLAKAKDIFVPGFKDEDKISSDLKGHVAIVKGLGIAVEPSGMFRPKDNIKLLDAALMVYRTLESMGSIK